VPDPSSDHGGAGPPGEAGLARDGAASFALGYAGLRLFLVVAHEDGSWRALSTGGPRDVLAHGPGDGMPLTDAASMLAHAAAWGPGERDRKVAGAVVGVLDRHGPGRRLAESFAAACGRASPLLLAEGDLGVWVEALDRLAGVDAVDAALLGRPLVAPFLRSLAYGLRDPSARLKAMALIRGDASDADTVAALRSADSRGRMPPGTDGDLSLRSLLRTMRGKRVPHAMADALLRAAPLAPPGWMPGTLAGAEAMVYVVERAVALAKCSRGGLDVATLLAPTHGKWEATATALSGTGADVLIPENLAGDVRDMAQAFDREVLHPAQRRMAESTGSPRPPAGRARSHVAAWQALFAGKGILSVTRTSVDWHRRSARMTRTVTALSGLGPVSWRPLFGDCRASNGLEVMEILSDDGLVDEGESLSHCVGGYAPGCADGSYAVLSVRDGGVRLSTAQVSPRGEVLQHRGASNAPPGAAETDALLEALRVPPRIPGLPGPFRSALEAVRAMPRSWRLWRARRWIGDHPYDHARAGNVEAALAVWSRFLPRPLRDAEALGRHGGLRSPSSGT